MAEGKITEYIDRDGVKGSTTFMLEQLNAIEQKFTTLSEFKLKLNTDGSFKDAANTQQNIKKATDDLTVSVKAYKSIQDQVVLTQAKINAQGSDQAQILAQNRIQLAATTAETKNAAKESLGLVGAYDKLNAQYKVAAQNAKNIGAAQGVSSQAFKDASAIALNYYNQLKAVDGGVGQFQRNVGNYAGSLKPAFDTLTSTLSTLKTELAGLNSGSPAFADTTQKIETLEQVISGLQGGFSSTRGELRAFQEATVKLGLSFGQTDEQFLKFNEAVGEVKNSIQDIKSATAFQAKDNKTFVGLIEAVNGLAGAYGTAQGAVALFGDDNADLQKQMVKLQGVLAIVNGLQAVANALETESGAVQLALAAKISLVNAAKKIQSVLVVQTVAAIQTEVAANAELSVSQAAVAASASAETVALEGAALASTEVAAASVGATAGMAAEAVAAESAAVATTEFATAFIATGIGAIIVAVGAALVYLTAKLPGWLAGSRLSTAQQLELADAIGKVNKSVLEQTKFLDSLDTSTTRYYKNAIALSQTAGENEEKRLAAQKALANEEQSLAQTTVDRLGATSAATAEAAENVRLYNEILKGSFQTQADIAKIPESRRTSEQKRDLEAAKNNEELYTKLLGTAKDTYSAMADARNTLFDKNQATAEQEVAAEKLTADEQRKLVLETTQIQADAVKAKNEQILNSDRSTQAQRLTALKSDRAAQIAVVNAQKNDVLDNPASSINDKVIAAEKANQELKAIQIKFGEDTYAINESYRLRNLAADSDIQKSRINSEKDSNDAIVKDDNNSLDQRLSAYAGFINAEKALANEEFETKLKGAGFSQEEIVALQKGDQVKIDGKKITNDELEGLEVEHTDRLKAINNTAGKDIYDITLSWAKKQEDAVINSNKSNGNTSPEIASYTTSLTALNDSLLKKTISIREYNDLRLRLEDQYQIAILDKTIAGDKASLDALKKNQEALAGTIEGAQNDLSNAYEGGNAQIIIDDENKLKALLEAEVKNNADIKAANETLNSDILKGQEARIARERANEEALAAAKQQLIAKTVEVIKTIGDATFTNDENAIQKQIDQVNTVRDAQIAAENASTDSAQDKADKIAVINATAAAQQSQLQLEQRKKQVEQAQFDKKIAIATIIETTAQAVVNALGAKPFTPANIALAEVIGGIGLAELAIAIATPIPTYRMGTENHPGGKALAGHGRPELVVLPTGEAFITPSTETMYDLPEHTRVLPDAAAAMADGSFNAMLMRGLGLDLAIGRSQGNGNDNEKHFDRMISAIKSNKQTVVINNTYLGVKSSFTNASRHVEWVNRNMQS